MTFPTPPRSLIDTPRVDAIDSVDALVELLGRSMGVVDSEGPDADPVDVGAHSLQCAALLAGTYADDEELVAAGLVHDLGHVVAPGCSAAHGDIAASMLAPLLGARVGRLVALHVPAKRYLAASEPGYSSTLSGGSTASLAVQGGPMQATERAALDADPELLGALALRRADEAAKVPGADVPGIAHWVPLLERVAATGSATHGAGA